MKRHAMAPAALMTATLMTATLTAATLTITAPHADAATVYTLEPLDYNISDQTPNTLQGAMCRGEYQCVKVEYPAALDPTHKDGVFGENGSISKGAAALNELLTHDPADKVGFGYSQGAQAIGFWLRNYAPTTTVSRDNTRFLLIGDPENTYGVPWSPKVPTDTGFDVTELWVQYDGWADWPDRPNPVAVANAIYGMLFVHPVAYEDLDIDDPSIVTWTANGITYRMRPTPELPILDPLRRTGFGWLADALNEPLAEQVEEAYDRPTTQQEADAQFGSAPVAAPDARSVAAPDVRSVAGSKADPDPVPLGSHRDATTPSTRRSALAESVSALVTKGRKSSAAGPDATSEKTAATTSSVRPTRHPDKTRHRVGRETHRDSTS
jgi:hypothetical protein